MQIWISNPKEVNIKLTNVNAIKLAKEIRTNKVASKESKHLAKEIEKYYNETLF